MITPIDTHGVCRAFVSDAHRVGILTKSQAQAIFGWLRARDYSKLTACEDLLSLGAKQTQANRTALRQVMALFKRNSDLCTGVDLKATALEGFKTNEELCRQTNVRLDDCGEHFGDLTPYVQSMRAYIRRTLGSFERFLSQLPDRVRTTSGASSTSSRRNTSRSSKLRKRIACTRRAVPFLQALSRYFGAGELQCEVVLRNRVTTVPKSWKTDRTIACEPEGCLPLQLAFDSWAKDRLMAAGIDLRNQGRNQDLARIGSIDGSLATVDMKAASDTVAYNTVVALFPWEWYNYLSSIRSPFYGTGSSYKRYHKFSSMGNGSTFAIETLIFAAACSATGAETFSVYGDDIIINTEQVPLLVELLDLFGFHINVDKTFISGPFRESCGADWYEGTNITPFYMNDEGRAKARQCHLINGLARIAIPEGELWSLLRTYVRKNSLPFVPFGDDTLAGVQISISDAYDQGLIRRRFGDTFYKGYVAKAKSLQEVASSHRTQGYLLWWLELRSPRKRVVPALNIRMDRMYQDLRDYKSVREDDPEYVFYKREWIRWNQPSTVAGPHLWMWSTFVAA